MVHTDIANINFSCHYLTVAQPIWMVQLVDSYENDADIAQTMTELAVIKMGRNEWELEQGLLKYRGKWVIGSKGDLRRQIFEMRKGLEDIQVQGLP